MRSHTPIWPPSPHCALLGLPSHHCQSDRPESDVKTYASFPGSSAAAGATTHEDEPWLTAAYEISTSALSGPTYTMGGKRKPRRRASIVYPTPPSTTSSAKHAVPLPAFFEHDDSPPRASEDLSAATTTVPVNLPPLSPPPTSSLLVLSLPSFGTDDGYIPLDHFTSSIQPLPRLTTGSDVPHALNQLPTPLSPAQRLSVPLDAIQEAEDEPMRWSEFNSAEEGSALFMAECSSAISSPYLGVSAHTNADPLDLSSSLTNMYPHSAPRSSMLSNLGLFVGDNTGSGRESASPFVTTTGLPELELFNSSVDPNAGSLRSPPRDTSPPAVPWSLSIPHSMPETSPAGWPPPFSHHDSSLLCVPQPALTSRWSPDSPNASPGAGDEDEGQGQLHQWVPPPMASPRPSSMLLPDLDMDMYPDPPDTPVWLSEPGSSRTSTLESLPVATPESSWLHPSPWLEPQEPPSHAPSPRPQTKKLPTMELDEDGDFSMAHTDSLLLASPARRPVDLPALIIDTRDDLDGHTVPDGDTVMWGLSSFASTSTTSQGGPVYNAHFTTEPETLSARVSPISPKRRGIRALPGAAFDDDMLPPIPISLSEPRRAHSWPAPHPASIALSEPPPSSSGLGLELGPSPSPPSPKHNLDDDPLLIELGIHVPPSPLTELGALCAIRRRSMSAERTARDTEHKLSARIRTLEDILLERMQTGSASLDDEYDGLPPRLELQALHGLRAESKRYRKREKARTRELGALLRLKLSGPARSLSLPILASSVGMPELVATIEAMPQVDPEEAKKSAQAVAELAAQMALRRRDAAGARPLLASTRRRSGLYVHSPLTATFRGSDDEEEQEEKEESGDSFAMVVT
jgi:hypothetical protein